MCVCLCEREKRIFWNYFRRLSNSWKLKRTGRERERNSVCGLLVSKTLHSNCSNYLKNKSQKRAKPTDFWFDSATCCDVCVVCRGDFGFVFEFCKKRKKKGFTFYIFCWLLTCSFFHNPFSNAFSCCLLRLHFCLWHSQQYSSFCLITVTGGCLVRYLFVGRRYFQLVWGIWWKIQTLMKTVRKRKICRLDWNLLKCGQVVCYSV